MKQIILLFLILLSFKSFSQRKYPITTIFKGDTVVMMTTAQSEKINYLIDSLDRKVQLLQIEKSNKEILLSNISTILKKKSESYDSIKMQADSMKIKVDSMNTNYAKLDSFKNEILNLAWMGAILYQRDDKSYCYIPMCSYKWRILTNDKIIMKPIRDENKWSSMRIADVPQPDNLSLHLWPHKYYPDKLKIQK